MSKNRKMVKTSVFLRCWYVCIHSSQSYLPLWMIGSLQLQRCHMRMFLIQLDLGRLGDP